MRIRPNELKNQPRRWHVAEVGQGLKQAASWFLRIIPCQNISDPIHRSQRAHSIYRCPLTLTYEKLTTVLYQLVFRYRRRRRPADVRGATWPYTSGRKLTRAFLVRDDLHIPQRFQRIQARQRRFALR